jgi:hypothetical protein
MGKSAPVREGSGTSDTVAAPTWVGVAGALDDVLGAPDNAAKITAGTTPAKAVIAVITAARRPGALVLNRRTAYAMTADNTNTINTTQKSVAKVSDIFFFLVRPSSGKRKTGALVGGRAFRGRQSDHQDRQIRP